MGLAVSETPIVKVMFQSHSVNQFNYIEEEEGIK